MELKFFVKQHMWPHMMYIHECTYIHEGEATRLAELALIFIPTVFIALSAKYRSQLHYK